MGFMDFLKKLTSSDDELNDAELRAARAKHGIRLDTPEEQKKMEQEEKEPYDPWEEVSNARMNFFLGGWATRKFRIVGEDKVKAQLSALEKKRGGAPKRSIEAELEALEKKEEAKKEKQKN
jgi:hypothetical protein